MYDRDDEDYDLTPRPRDRSGQQKKAKQPTTRPDLRMAVDEYRAALADRGVPPAEIEAAVLAREDLRRKAGITPADMSK